MIYRRRVEHPSTKNYKCVTNGSYISPENADKYVSMKGGATKAGYDQIVYWPDSMLAGPATEIAEHIKNNGSTHAIVGTIFYLSNGKLGSRGAFPITAKLIYENSFNPLDARSALLLGKFMSLKCQLPEKHQISYDNMVENLENKLPLPLRRKRHILKHVDTLLKSVPTEEVSPQINVLQNICSSKDAEIEKLRQQICEQQNICITKDAEMEKLQVQINEQQDMCIRKAVEMEKLRAQINEQQNKCTSKDVEIRDLRAQIDEQRNKFVPNNGELEQLNKQLNELKESHDHIVRLSQIDKRNLLHKLSIAHIDLKLVENNNKLKNMLERMEPKLRSLAYEDFFGDTKALLNQTLYNLEVTDKLSLVLEVVDRNVADLKLHLSDEVCIEILLDKFPAPFVVVANFEHLNNNLMTFIKFDDANKIIEFYFEKHHTLYKFPTYLYYYTVETIKKKCVD